MIYLNISLSQKVSAGQYTRVKELIADFEQIISNCVEYNGPDNDVTKLAIQMKAKCKPILDKELALEDGEKSWRNGAPAGSAVVAGQKHRPHSGRDHIPRGRLLASTFAFVH